MSTMSRLGVAIAMAVAACPASATVTILSSSASFLSLLNGGAYTETLSVANPAFPVPDAIGYGKGAFGFVVLAEGGVYTNGAVVGANSLADVVKGTFSARVTGVGGNFFMTYV